MGKNKVKKHKVKLHGKMVNEPHDTSGTPAVHTLTNRMDSFLGKLGQTGLRDYSNYLNSPWRIFWSNLLAGVARGFGFFFGVTILISIIGYILTDILSNIPVVGDFFSSLNIWIQSTLESARLRIE